MGSSPPPLLRHRLTLPAVVLVGIILGALLVVSVNTSTALNAERAEARDRDAAYRDQLRELSGALRDTVSIVQRRPASLQFQVCWAARLGDFVVAIPELSSERDEVTEADLAQFGRIAQAVRDTLRPVSQGGCIDDDLPVEVPPPTKLHDD